MSTGTVPVKLKIGSNAADNVNASDKVLEGVLPAQAVRYALVVREGVSPIFLLRAASGEPARLFIFRDSFLLYIYRVRQNT